MVVNISSALSAYQKAGSSTGIKSVAEAAPVDGTSFTDTLKDFMGDAIESVKKSENLAAQGAVGKADLQEVILAVSEAEMMVKTFTSVRDKVIAAYQEVIRTSI